jgi:Flp pilus assembly protein TadD
VNLIPDNPELRYNPAIALRQHNRIPGAIEELRVALKLDPSQAVFSNALQRLTGEEK